MRTLALLLLAATALPASALAAGCEPMRFGYTTQHVPPYYLGSGTREDNPPGASVELVREIAASAGCDTITVRLPPARLLLSVEAGDIDATALGGSDGIRPKLAYPLDAQGKPDASRGLQLQTVVFVRASDRIAHDVDTAQYLRGRRIGTFHGARYAALFRQMGYTVDDGGADIRANLDKLMLRRIDGFAVALASPGDMDAEVAAHYGNDIVRLEQPLRTSVVWLLLNRDYYERNREHAEAMWNWLGTHGRKRFAELLKKYDKTP